jgi:hypothetical protein
MKNSKDTNSAASVSEAAKKPDTPGCVQRWFGVFLILFALTGGYANLTKPLPATSEIEAILDHASRPVNNAVTIVAMILMVWGGLALTGILSKKK